MRMKLTGRVMKGIGGFYYVDCRNVLYECKARGIFKKEQIKILVGDLVDVEVLNENEKVGNIVHLHFRKNEIIRPAMANVDRIIMVFTVSRPKPDFRVLDRLLLGYRYQNIPAALVFNKTDEAGDEICREIADIYRNAGIPVLFVSAKEQDGLEKLRELLQGHFSVLSGNSGVGKSTLINALCPEAEMDTGEISGKIGRGKHTTRHSEIFRLGESTWVADTPGYGRVAVPAMEPEDLADYYPEFEPYRFSCKFQPCTHLHEPDCAVRTAVAEGKISVVRYDNYRDIFEELKGNKR